jgi:hypothetical protein
LSIHGQVSDLVFIGPRAEAPSRAWLRRVLRRAPLWLIIPLLICSGGALAANHGDGLPAIRWDGVGYYAWTEALLHGDLSFCQWSQDRGFNAISGGHVAHPGRCENKYPPGLAVLRLPVMAPIALLTDHQSDRTLNISDAEEHASEWLGIAALLITATLMWATLRRLGVASRRAQLLVLALIFGTGLFDYGAFDSSYTHVYSAALFAALIYVGVTATQRRSAPNAILVFLLSLFIAWMREPDILPLALLAAAWAWHQSRAPTGRRRLGTIACAIAPVPAGIAVALALQVAYSRWATGGWTLNSYGSERLSLARHFEPDVLFSYNHGLFTWYPVIGLMLIIGLWRRASRPWAWLAASAIASLTLVYGSWDIWSLGVSMGMRGMVDVVPLVAVAAGVAIADLPRRTLGAVFVAAAILTCVTVELMVGYWTGALPQSFANAQLYWQQVAGLSSSIHP